MSRAPPVTPPSPHWLVRPPLDNASYTPSPNQNSPMSDRHTGAMYQNQSNFTSYPYGGPANEAPPGWNPNLVPDGQYPPNWYMPEQGPSSSFNGFQQPLPPGYPPGNLAFQPPRQNTNFASPYTPSQSSGLTFENQPFPSGSSSKGDNSSTGPKKKRKKVPVEAEGTASVGSPPGDGEKEKRLKTGRACDACVCPGP